MDKTTVETAEGNNELLREYVNDYLDGLGDITDSQFYFEAEASPLVSFTHAIETGEISPEGLVKMIEIIGAKNTQIFAQALKDGNQLTMLNIIAQFQQAVKDYIKANTPQED